MTFFIHNGNGTAPFWNSRHLLGPRSYSPWCLVRTLLARFVIFENFVWNHWSSVGINFLLLAYLTYQKSLMWLQARLLAEAWNFGEEITKGNKQTTGHSVFKKSWDRQNTNLDLFKEITFFFSYWDLDVNWFYEWTIRLKIKNYYSLDYK